LPPAPTPPPRDSEGRTGLAVPLAPPDKPRRRLLLIDRNQRQVAAVMYAEQWRQKVEVNASLDLLRSIPPGSYANPVVTVSVRSDGSVEAVVINRTSGLPQVDDAVRRIVESLGPFSRFPGELAQDYDVLDIRRVWTFDVAVRLFPGIR
jgi:outer membrane biosynthesis protein TonB